MAGYWLVLINGIYNHCPSDINSDKLRYESLVTREILFLIKIALILEKQQRIYMSTNCKIEMYTMFTLTSAQSI